MKVIGLDVHSATFTIAILDESGKLQKCRKDGTSEENLISAVHGLTGAKLVILEESHANSRRSRLHGGLSALHPPLADPSPHVELRDRCSAVQPALSELDQCRTDELVRHPREGVRLLACPQQSRRFERVEATQLLDQHGG